MSPNTTETRTATNRENAKKSTGPRDTSSTRYNATKHGLLSKGVTELDNPEEYAGLMSQLEGEYCPLGIVECELVRQIAMCVIRCRRSRMLEAEEITAGLNPPVTKIGKSEFENAFSSMDKTIEVLDAGMPARLPQRIIANITTTLLRYETSNENRMFRCLVQLERLQQLRGRERAPAGKLSDDRNSDALASFGSKTPDTHVLPLERAGTT